MRWLNVGATIINVTLVAVLAYFLFFGPGLRQDGLSYADLVTILLAVAAVVLTAVTVIVAVAALWGYNAIRQAAIRESTGAARKAAREAAEPVAMRTAREVVGDAVGGGGLTEAMWKEDGDEGSTDGNGAG